MRKLALARVSYRDYYFFISYRVYMMTGSFHISLLSSLRNLAVLCGCEIKVLAAEPCSKKRE